MTRSSKASQVISNDMAKRHCAGIGAKSPVPHGFPIGGRPEPTRSRPMHWHRASKEPAKVLAEEIFYRCLENGLSFKISMGSVLTLYPALVTTREDMEKALGIIDDAIAAAA